MDRAISRRDFLNGVSLAVGGALVASPGWRAFGLPFPEPAEVASQNMAGYYPPALHGLRGSHDGSWEVAHELRDGKAWDQGADDGDPEFYDLIVVGGGISGLAAAYLFRQAVGTAARILVLDNHDDFGGHAKRNEFRAGGRLLIGYGGTQSIDGPAHYSAEARALLAALGVDVQKFYRYFDRDYLKSRNLRQAVFFDKETFGEDRLVAGLGQPTWSDFLARTPLSEAVRKDILRLQGVNGEKEDYLAGLSQDEKKSRLARTSYRDFLLNHVRVHPDTLLFYQARTHGLYGMGPDGVPALDCWALGLPGFEGMGLELGPAREMGLSAVPKDQEEPYIFHFPDGNASLARLLVRALVPRSTEGSTMEDIVTARVDYARLDESDSPVRIRLNSTVVRVKHRGEPATAKEVEVTYVQAGQAKTVRGGASILACYHSVIPYLSPELPEPQKRALSQATKVPLVYTNVQIRNAQAFHRLGVGSISCPGSYYSRLGLDFPVSMGDYRYPASSDEPCVIHLTRTPCSPGLSSHEQHKVGRVELVTTSFETFERNTRDLMARALGEGGFDPARDIEAITVNRWPHGYAYEYNALFDPFWPDGEKPCVIARQPFGRIAIANSDAAAYAYTDAAIDQAHRAVRELLVGAALIP
jgi:spermidine dehydrogenase